MYSNITSCIRQHSCNEIANQPGMYGRDSIKQKRKSGRKEICCLPQMTPKKNIKTKCNNQKEHLIKNIVKRKQR